MLNDLLSLTKKQKKTIKSLDGVIKVWRGICAEPNKTLIYVSCDEGIAAVSDKGELSWQR